jgi:plasmid stabilization system protein ParE
MPPLPSSFQEAVRAIEDNPEAWARRGRRSDVRAFPLDRYPYSIVYRVRPTLIRVLAVAHARRRPDYWEGRR